MGVHMGFGWFWSIAPLFIAVIFIIVIGSFVVMAVKGIAQWSKNNAAPVLSVDATVVAKRADVSHHSHADAGNNGMHHTSTSTSYYATFQVESGDRLELRIPGDEYGKLVEGDLGKLTFQGTRYQGFQRKY